MNRHLRKRVAKRAMKLKDKRRKLLHKYSYLLPEYERIYGDSYRLGNFSIKKFSSRMLKLQGLKVFL